MAGFFTIITLSFLIIVDECVTPDDEEIEDETNEKAKNNNDVGNSAISKTNEKDLVITIKLTSPQVSGLFNKKRSTRLAYSKREQ